jgi:glycosyltransferase involved in cell wall biosynthesis
LNHNTSSKARSILLSIVVPFRDRIDYLYECLKSIAMQQAVDWECILVDDASTPSVFDRIQLKIEEDSRFRILRPIHRNAVGPAHCRNRGLKQAQGRYVWFFDSDDLMLPGAIENVFSGIEDGSPDLLLGQYSYLGGESSLQPRRYRSNEAGQIFRQHCNRDVPVITACAVWSVPFILDQARHFWPEHLSQSEDYVFYARLLSCRPRTFVGDWELFLYRQHSGGISRLGGQRLSRHDDWLRAMEQRFRARVEVLRLAAADPVLLGDRQCLARVARHSIDAIIPLRNSVHYRSACKLLADCFGMLPPSLRLRMMVSLRCIGLTGRGARIVYS